MESTAYMPELIIERVHPLCKLPQYATEGDSGLDLFAPEDVRIMPMETLTVPTGFRMEIPKHAKHGMGYRWEAQVRPKSGLSKDTGLRVILGTIDNFYRDEICVTVENTSAHNTWTIPKNSKFAQIVFNEIIRPLKITEGTISLENDRGGGFGSTGLY